MSLTVSVTSEATLARGERRRVEAGAHLDGLDGKHREVSAAASGRVHLTRGHGPDVRRLDRKARRD